MPIVQYIQLLFSTRDIKILLGVTFNSNVCTTESRGNVQVSDKVWTGIILIRKVAIQLTSLYICSLESNNKVTCTFSLLPQV